MITNASNFRMSSNDKIIKRFLFKKNDQSDIKNYRPISVLPTISKLMEYFTSHNLLASQQYGFRPNRSTELAALELMDRNVNCMNQNSCPINIYLDLSKAFDSLKYDMLLSKLHYYGLQNNALRLLKSYLHGRSQYVQIENVKSCSHPVLCGIVATRFCIGGTSFQHSY